MSIKPCLGRTRVSDGRKWYIDKNKPSTLYTCCEECYYKNIKGTDRENDFSEFGGNNCNCDYELYNTDCNFTDCSIVNAEKKIRISIVKNNGVRCKYIDGIFYVPSDATYSVLIENIDTNPKTYIEIESLEMSSPSLLSYLNPDKEINRYTLEIPITDNTIPKVNMTIKINKYTQMDDPITLDHLQHKHNGIYCDSTGKPIVKLKMNGDIKYKALLNVDIFSSTNDDTFSCEFCTEWSNESNSDDEFEITI